MIDLTCRNLATALIVLIGSSFASFSSHAQPLNESEIIIPGGVNTGSFGNAMAVSGDTMVIGASGPVLESAYVYRFDGNAWIEEQELTAPSDVAQFGGFAASVAISGDTIVIGTRQFSVSGAAYVYRFNGSSWNLDQKLTGSPGFGLGVAVNGDTMVIAGLGDVLAQVYRFDGNAWIEEQTLDKGSASLAVSGDTIVIGNGGADDRRGSATVYRFDGNQWVEEQTLTASDAQVDDRFGPSVAVNGDTIAVGNSPSISDDTNGLGSVYIFRFDGNQWAEEQKLNTFDRDAELNYGVSSVALGEDTVVFGTQFGGGFTGDGAAYLYRFDGSTWGQERELIASDKGAGLFGSSVALHRDTVLVGSQQKRAVYLFPLPNSNTAPTITSAAEVSVAENQTSAIDVNATDDSDAEGAGLTYAISDGADQSLFAIDAMSGVVTFISAPDFEAPGDAGGDNAYNITVTVTDSSGLSDTQTITITVKDGDDVEPPVDNSDVECEYFIKADWNRGYIGVIRLTNNGESAVKGWTVNWTYGDGAKVVRLWNAHLEGDDPYTASARRWNSTIQPGSYVQFGMKNRKPFRNAPAVAPQVTGDICN